jgi:hypothetical protein
MGDDRFTENDDAAAENEVNALPEEAKQNDSPVDLTGGQTIEGGEELTAEEVNQLDADTVAENENMMPPGSIPNILKTSDDITEPQSEKVVQNDKYVQERPITHVKNMVNKQIFAITPDLMKRRDLMPCDEDGKLVYDHRRFN